jgi:hypothetical protein
MRQYLPFRDSFGLQVIKLKPIALPDEQLPLDGTFYMEHWRSGKLINKFSFHNGITSQGKNYLLNCGFVSGAQILTASWCMSLIDNNNAPSGTPILAASDTMGGSRGWVEFTGYTQTSRPKWNPATSTAQLLTNPTLCQFDIGTTGVVFGGFIVSDSAIGGAAGTLWTTGAFPSATNVTGGTDQLRLVYNLAA